MAFYTVSHEITVCSVCKGLHVKSSFYVYLYPCLQGSEVGGSSSSPCLSNIWYFYRHLDLQVVFLRFEPLKGMPLRSEMHSSWFRAQICSVKYDVMLMWNMLCISYPFIRTQSTSDSILNKSQAGIYIPLVAALSLCCLHYQSPPSLFISTGFKAARITLAEAMAGVYQRTDHRSFTQRFPSPLSKAVANYHKGTKESD